MSLVGKDKTTQWQITVYEDQWPQFKRMHPAVRSWAWQVETCPDTKKLHYQGYMVTRQQHRFSPAGIINGKQKYKPNQSLLRLFPGVHIEPAENFAALVNYCKKEDSRTEGYAPVHQVNDTVDMFSLSEDLASRLPNWASVRKLWTAHTESVMYQCRRRQSDCESLGLKKYDSPAEFAYYVLLKDMIDLDIRSGKPIEFIVQNPLFITMWKNKIEELIFRQTHPYSPPPSISDRQTDNSITISFD